SSFSQTDALTPLAPSASTPLPLPVGNQPRGHHPYGWRRRPCWRQPLAGTLQLQAAVPTGGCRPCELAVTGRARGLALATAGRPLAGSLGFGWPTLHGG
ncbi:hypothetical protein GW17_00054376, partial [Ensete ventricosum]